MKLPLTRAAVAASLLLWATHVFASVQYAVTDVTFSNKSAATIDMSDGWSLASLTNQSGEPIDFRPLRTNATTVAPNNGSLFSPDQNINSLEGPWVATFNAPANTVIDHLELPIILYTGATDDSAYGLPQTNKASTTLTATVTLININGGTRKVLTKAGFSVRGTGDFSPTGTYNSEPFDNTQIFDFTPQAVTSIEVKIVQDADSGMNAGLSKLVFGGYTATPETVTFSSKTTTSITLSGGWTLTDKSHNFQTSGAVGQTSSLTPNANVSADTPWYVTFAAPEARTVSAVSFGVVMFNSSGGVQSAKVTRTIRFTVDAFGEDSTKLGTATSGDLTLTGNSTTEARETPTITFENPIENVKKLKITVSAPTPDSNKGCYFGLTQLQVTSPLTITEGAEPTTNLPATIWANPTAWPTSALTLGGVYLGTEATLPAVTVASESVAADVIRVLPSVLNVTADEAVMEKTLITARAYRGPADPENLTATLAGANEVDTLRPGQTRRGVQLTTSPTFTLAIATEHFTTATTQAMLYATGNATRLHWGDNLWWHSDADGTAAVQGALPEGCEQLLWLEDGATIELDASATALAFVDERQNGILEIPAGVSLAYTPDIAPGLSSPNIPDGITVKLLGSLTMTGTLPALEVSGEVASLGAGEGDLTVTALTGSGTLTVSGGTLSVDTSDAITYALADGSALTVTAAAAALPAVTVTGAAALNLGDTASAACVTIAEGATLATDADTVGKVSEWSLAGGLSVANATGEITLALADDAGTLTFNATDTATRPRGWWSEVTDGTLTLGQIAAGAGAETSTTEEALFQKIVDTAELTIPTGTKAFTYITANTSGTLAGDQAQALAVAELFTIAPTEIGEPDENGVSTAKLVYDFGVDNIFRQTIDDTNYLILTVKVQGSDGQAVDFADATAVAVKALDGQGNSLADCTPEEVDDTFAPFSGEARGSGPVRYFRVPLPAENTFFKAEASQP